MDKARRGHLYPVKVPAQCPAEISALIADCTAVDPAARPSSAAVLRRLLAAAGAAAEPLPAVGTAAAAAGGLSGGAAGDSLESANVV